MQQDSWDTPQDSNPPPSGDGQSPDQHANLARVPPPLRNWRVVDTDIAQETASTGIIQPRRNEAGAEGNKSEAMEPEGIEIEGESTLGASAEPDRQPRGDAAFTVQGGDAAGSEPDAIPDRTNRFIGLGIGSRRFQVEPGQPVSVPIELFNNGDWASRFEVTLEGWINEAWCPDLPLRVYLEPGESCGLKLTITPPPDEMRAGAHPVAVVVHATRYAGHVARCGAMLDVPPRSEFRLGRLQPEQIHTSWLRREATFQLPVHNRSNHPAGFILHGIDRHQTAAFTFHVDAQWRDAQGGERQRGSALEPWDGVSLAMDPFDDAAHNASAQPGPAYIHLEAGERIQVPVTVRPGQFSLFGTAPRATPFRIAAGQITPPQITPQQQEQANARQVADGELICAPLIGPWQMIAAAVVTVVVLFGLGLAGLALLMALRSTPAAQTAVAAQATPPPVTFVIQLEQPAPTRDPAAVPTSAAMGSAAQAGPQTDGAPQLPAGRLANGELTDGEFTVGEFTDGASADDAGELPVVQADQVTAPGDRLPENSPPLQPQPLQITTPAPDASMRATPAAVAQPGISQSSGAQPMTYAQMFQQIALRYDLDWRMLASIAYVESGFDSVALGSQGDMGLMQIRPSTWQEWAPAVEAADPFDSYSNVLVSAVYLDYLRTMLGERGLTETEWMLVAYNWGPDQVLNFVNTGGAWDTLAPERRQYAIDILRMAQTIP